MKHPFEITFAEVLWSFIALVLALVLLAKFGGFDDASVRVLPEGTPHGVTGTLKGEQP